MNIEEIIENLNGIEERKYNTDCNISDTHYIYTYDCNIIYNQSKYSQVEYV